LPNIRIIFFTFGSLSIAVQTLLIRAFISNYSGNEFVMGFCLSSWLTGVALGGFFMGRISDRIERKDFAFRVSLLLCGILSIISVLFAISSKKIFGLLPYEIAPISRIILSSFLITLPVSLIFGFTFALSVSYLRTDESIRVVYFFESTGSFLGGGILSAGIIPFLSHISGGLLILSISLFTLSLWAKRWIWRGLISFLSILLIISLFFDREIGKFFQWIKLGINPEDYRSSPFGEFLSFEKEGTNYVLLNTLPIITYPERKSVEMNIFLPLLLSDGNSEVLFVGGSLSGEGRLLPENARASFIIYPKDVLDMEGKFFRMKRNLNVISKDPIKFLREEKNEYGVVAVLHPDPSSAQENRVFTDEFFQLVKKRIKRGGFLVVFAGEPSNYMSEEQADYLACLMKTLKNSFSHVQLLPSVRFAFIASDTLIDVNSLIEKLNIFNANYARREYLLWDASEERRSYYISEIEKAIPHIRINSIERPSLYFYYMRFLGGKEGMEFKDFMRVIEEVKVWHLLIFLLLLTGISLKKEFFEIPSLSLFGAFIVGFCGLLSEVTLAILYQSSYGYLYFTVGLFLSGFMGGLALGAWGRGKGHRGFIMSLTLLFFFSLFNWWLFFRVFIIQVGIFYGTIIFFILNFLYGFLTGRIFRESASLIKNQTGRSAGIMDGIDHLGGAISAFFSSLLFIPVFGCSEPFLLIGALSLCGILSAFLFLLFH